MKYRLKKDLPKSKAGTIIECDNMRIDPYGFIECKDHPDWFEPVEDRIKLHRGHSFVSKNPNELTRNDHKSFSLDEIKIMEQAINGELFTKEDIKEMVREGVQWVHEQLNYRYPISYSELINEWIKENKSQTPENTKTNRERAQDKADGQTY